LSVTGHGTVTLNGSNTYAGATNVSSGTLIVGPTGSIASAVINVTGGTLRVENGGTLTAATPLNADLALTIGGTVELDSSPAGSPTVLQLSKLYISGSTNNWTGKLDLSNNALIGAYGSTGQINLAQITNQIKSGFAGGTWTGNGITSSAAAADTSHLTALGVILNSPDGTTYDPNSIYPTFDGIKVYSNDILVELTYYGDANLDGQVDGSDYSLIDYAYNYNLANPTTPVTGWANGDFNYDGVIDGSDYTLIDNAFNSQGANLGGGKSGGGGTFVVTAEEIAAAAAVPEPATLTLFICGAALGTLKRRRSSQSITSSAAANLNFPVPLNQD
jgi:autotransporter-associated beta strand protein